MGRWAGRSALGARLFVELGVERGVATRELLNGTDLTFVGLSSATTGVSPGDELRILRNLLDAVGDQPGLGVEAGRRVTSASMGAWGIAMLTSRTWHDVFGLAQRFATITPTFLRLSLSDGDTGPHMLIRDDHLPDDVRDVLTERDLAAFLAVAVFAARSSGQLELHTRLDGERGASLAGLAEGTVTVHPGHQPQHIAVTARARDTTLPHADEATRRRCVQECGALLARNEAPDTTTSTVREILLSNPANMPNMDSIARELHIDTRTLHRRLHAEKTTYRRLRDEIRYTISLQLLRDLQLSVTEVARHLGYTEPTAFTHAFNRWHGTAPSTLRHQPAPNP